MDKKLDRAAASDSNLARGGWAGKQLDIAIKLEA